MEVVTSSKLSYVFKDKTEQKSSLKMPLRFNSKSKAKEICKKILESKKMKEQNNEMGLYVSYDDNLDNGYWLNSEKPLSEYNLPKGVSYFYTPWKSL